MQWVGFLAAAALALFLADREGMFGTRPAPAGSDYERYHGKTFRVARVVDGDTIDIAAPDRGKPTTRVRLWGVDTPETKRRDTPVQHFGPEATAFTKSACQDRQVKIELEPHTTRGTYGRLLAYVILPDGTMLNRELVRQGFGYADPRFPHRLKPEFLSLQNEARQQRRGLWKDVRRKDLPSYWRDKLSLP